MNLIIVEDEPRVRSFLESSLKKDGYDIQSLGSFQELQDFLEAPSLKPELWILDRMIFNNDTLTLLPTIRKQFPDSKILFLSALASPSEKTEALDQGADDYLSKPFSLMELAARLRVLSRRTGSGQQTNVQNSRLELADLCVDLMAHEVRVKGKRVDISGKEFEVLRCLMQKPGQVLNRFQLLDRAWGVQFDVESNVVEVTLKNLRKKLDEAQSSVQILNRRNLGYWVEVES